MCVYVCVRFFCGLLRVFFLWFIVNIIGISTARGRKEKSPIPIPFPIHHRCGLMLVVADRLCIVFFTVRQTSVFVCHFVLKSYPGVFFFDVVSV